MKENVIDRTEEAPDAVMHRECSLAEISAMLTGWLGSMYGAAALLANGTAVDQISNTLGIGGNLAAVFCVAAIGAATVVGTLSAGAVARHFWPAPPSPVAGYAGNVDTLGRSAKRLQLDYQLPPSPRF